MHLFDLPARRRLEDHLRCRLAAYFPDATLSGGGLGGCAAMLRDTVLGGGKRLRPQLCVWTWQTASAADPGSVADSPPVGEPLLDVACGWELFHAFLLVHDDIIDGSDTRRGLPALHRRLASLDSNSRVFGERLGIVAGDLLFTAALRLWQEADLPWHVHKPLLNLVTRIAFETGFGQTADVCQSHTPIDHLTDDDVLRGYDGKTSAYTFEGPMLSGAILAGVDPSAYHAIAAVARAIGRAYQIHNDWLDLADAQHEGSDIVQGKQTLTLLRTRQRLDDATRAELDRRLLAVRPETGGAVERAEQVRSLLLEGGGVRTTREALAECLAAASGAADGLPEGLRDGTKGLLRRLGADYLRLG